MPVAFTESKYESVGDVDEMFSGGSVRPTYKAIGEWLNSLRPYEYSALQSQAEVETQNHGITFTVYADSRGTERIFPFSLIPRIIEAAEWRTIEAGLKQRIKALNLFLADVYSEARCVRDDVIPADLALGNPQYRGEMKKVRPTHGCYVNVAGLDLIRSSDGGFRVLEDNLRTPSGVSYVIENRRTMRSILPGLFPPEGVEVVDDYPDNLLDALVSVRPAGVPADSTHVVLLTPGHFNSAYFEHSFLARQMGIELVEGRDLVVQNNVLYVRATTGLERVDVVYRRIDDDFIDPEVYNPDSMIGVPGLMSAYEHGNVTIANAPGTGVADDKATYRYVPNLIEYYLGEKPIIANIDSYLGREEKGLEYILDNLPDLVVKPVDGSGGYGILIGPQASKQAIRARREEIVQNPARWMAQPLQQFSTIPCANGDHLEPRRSDLRAFVVTGEESWVLPGGLTRVAPNSSSYVVNSSQGGGSKDTWVIRSRGARGNGA